MRSFSRTSSLFLCVFPLVLVPGLLLAAVLPDGFRLEPVLAGLTEPSAINATPDGSLWIAERTTGTLRQVRYGRLVAGAACQVAVESSGEGGLLGVAAHPDFMANHYLYLYYTAAGTGTNKVTRYTMNGGACTSPLDVLPDLGSSPTFMRNGGGIGFGPDGKLYVGTGDTGMGSMGQDDLVMQGKVLRVNDDGTIPSDNPTPGSAVFAMGVRDGSGLAVAASGQVYTVDSGSDSDVSSDEVNAVPAGGNLGWDMISGDSGGAFDDPLMSWSSPVIGVAAVAVYGGPAFPDLAADGLDSDHDAYGNDRLPGRARRDDDGNGVCIGSVNAELSCTSDTDCPDRAAENAYCFYEDEADEHCPGGTSIGDDNCDPIDEPDESYPGNLFVLAPDGDAILRAVLDPADPSVLDVSSTFLDSAALADCPSGWSAITTGMDGFLYVTATNGGGAAGALYRVVRDTGPGPREVSAAGSPFPLTVERGPGAGQVTVSWEDLRDDAKQPRDNGTDPLAPAREYTVWEGALGSFSSHAPVTGLDATPGSAVNDALRTATFSADAGDRYFLVSGRGDNLEGTLGRGSDDVERAGYATTDRCDHIGYHSSSNGWSLWTCGRNFALQDENGETHSLAELRGSVVAMDFAAVWCGPCVSEANQQEALNQAYKSRGVKLLTVLMDEDVNGIDWSGRPSWSECRKWGIRPDQTNPPLVVPDHTFSCWADPAPTRHGWPLYNKWSALPTNVILDSGGRVIYTAAGFSSSTVSAKLNALVGTTASCVH